MLAALLHARSWPQAEGCGSAGGPTAAHLGGPCKVAGVQTQGPELLVATADAQLAYSHVRGELGHRRLATHLVPGRARVHRQSKMGRTDMHTRTGAPQAAAQE